MIPSSSNGSALTTSFDHSVSRSNELISCCKTAWKIQQQEQPLGQPPPPKPIFQLANTHGEPPPSLSILEEGLTLLRAMEYGLKQLQVLVRRRGHTNDPTQDIAMLVQQMEQDTQELTDFCQQLLQTRRRSKQATRHWEFVVQWFQQVANHYSTQLQSCLKVRGDVLAEQAQQRKKLMVDPKQKRSAPGNRRIASSTATPLFDSPLFAQPYQRPPHSANGHSQNGTTNGGGYSSVSAPTSSASSYYGGAGIPATAGTGSTVAAAAITTTSAGGYGGAYGGGGYGATSTSSIGVVGGTGIRQRKGDTVASHTDTTSIDYTLQQEEEEKVHHQIQLRKQKRHTQQRLNEAQQAETMLGELGQLFGKMSNLISQQGEVLEKIEDDVEAAHADIIAGQEELTNLYSLKKGNRPLIIKTFLILNFLIIFMRAYKK